MFKNKNFFKKLSAKKVNIVFVFLCFFALLLLARPALAQVDFGLQFGNAIGLTDTDPRIIAAKIVRVALTFLGLIAVSLVLYAGFLWMTSGGDLDKISKAKKLLINAVIGLAIILAAWGITAFIIGKLNDAVGGGGGGDGGGGDGSGGWGSALGNGIIEWHYPARNETDVPRNTNIQIAFKAPMDASTIITDGKINADNIKIFRVECTGEDGACNPELNESIENALIADEVSANKTDDDKIFVFDPVENLGSDKEPIWYAVNLKGGNNGLKTADGEAAFGLNGYEWQFEVSTKLDLAPPHVISVFPKQQGEKTLDDCLKSGKNGEECSAAVEKAFNDCVQSGKTRAQCGAVGKNAVVQINFNEPVNAITVTGKANSSGKPDGVGIYQKSASGENLVYGIFSISNGGKTVEFITETTCGVNSCGQDIYCLPANADLKGLVTAASLKSCNNNVDCDSEYKCDLVKGICQNKQDPNKYYPNTDMLDGVVDLSGNSLDGNIFPNPGPNKLNGDGKAQGKGLDDFYWNFFTTDQMDLTPPKIEVVNPDIDATGISLDWKPDIKFSEGMMYSTLINGCVPPEGDDKVCYIVLTSSNNPGYWINAYQDTTETDKTHAEISHVKFLQNAKCNVAINSNVKDLYQNCYQPCDGPGCESSYKPGDTDSPTSCVN